MPEDLSSGYEAIAEEFMAVRRNFGRGIVQKWAASLPRSCSVVDVGAGFGEPLTSALIEEGLAVSAIDASPAMVAEFTRRFPEVEVACEPAERSRFFGRTFDAAMAVGLIFLLPADNQRELIHRISNALNPGGALLITAPVQAGTWTDNLTGQTATSLGDEEYRRIFAEFGLDVISEHVDEGGAHYYQAQKA